MSNPNEWVTAQEAADTLGVTRSALCARRRNKRAPAWVDLTPEMGRATVRYRLSDILSFRDARHIPEGQPTPTLIELATRLATVEERLAKVERRKVVKQRKAIKRRTRTVSDSLL